jgi:hypothetical protein
MILTADDPFYHNKFLLAELHEKVIRGLVFVRYNTSVGVKFYLYCRNCSNLPIIVGK